MIFLQYVYIQEKEKSKKIWWQKFNRIKMEKIGDNSYLYTVSHLDHKNTLKQLEKKIQKKQGKEVQVIFSKEAEFLKKQWKGKKIDIETFKKISLPLLLDYLLEQIQEKPQTLLLQDIYFCAKTLNEENKQIIEYFLEKVKTVNIVTTELKSFQKLEEKCGKEKGIWITVSNNKRKSLNKARWIVNLDFSAEQLETYQINRQAMIINCAEEKITKEKGFEGVIVQSFDIELVSPVEKILEEKFTSLAIIASQFSFVLDYEENVRKLKQMGVNIRNLIGINGKINQKELLNHKKFLTNKNI